MVRQFLGGERERLPLVRGHIPRLRRPIDGRGRDEKAGGAGNFTGRPDYFAVMTDQLYFKVHDQIELARSQNISGDRTRR